MRRLFHNQSLLFGIRLFSRLFFIAIHKISDLLHNDGLIIYRFSFSQNREHEHALYFWLQKIHDNYFLST